MSATATEVTQTPPPALGLTQAEHTALTDLNDQGSYPWLIADLNGTTIDDLSFWESRTSKVHTTKACSSYRTNMTAGSQPVEGFWRDLCHGCLKHLSGAATGTRRAVTLVLAADAASLVRGMHYRCEQLIDESRDLWFADRTDTQKSMTNALKRLGMAEKLNPDPVLAPKFATLRALVERVWQHTLDLDAWRYEQLRDAWMNSYGRHLVVETCPSGPRGFESSSDMSMLPADWLDRLASYNGDVTKAVDSMRAHKVGDIEKHVPFWWAGWATQATLDPRDYDSAETYLRAERLKQAQQMFESMRPGWEVPQRLHGLDLPDVVIRREPPHHVDDEPWLQVMGQIPTSWQVFKGQEVTTGDCWRVPFLLWLTLLRLPGTAVALTRNHPALQQWIENHGTHLGSRDALGTALLDLPALATQAA